MRSWVYKIFLNYIVNSTKPFPTSVLDRAITIYSLLYSRALSRYTSLFKEASSMHLFSLTISQAQYMQCQDVFNWSNKSLFSPSSDCISTLSLYVFSWLENQHPRILYHIKYEEIIEPFFCFISLFF